MINYKVIIARYNEDVAWIEDFPLIHDHAILYNKGSVLSSNSYEIKTLTNNPPYTREADALLNYIIDNYQNLPEYLFFIQADPFDHCFNFLDVFTDIIEKNIYKSYLPLTFGWKLEHNIPPIANINYDDREYIGEHKIYMQYADNKLNPLNYYDGGLHDIMKDFRNHHQLKQDANILKFIYKKLYLDKKPYANFIKYNYGAMFGVKRENILSNSLDMYKSYLEFNSQHRTHVFILERMWYTIFLDNII